jgi:hypothetical protein
VIRQPAAWILWVITWTIGWWIGIIESYGAAVSNYYFGEVTPTWSGIQSNIQFVTLCWLVLGVLQIISLRSYLQSWSWMLMMWLIGMSVLWGVWWGSLIYFVSDNLFPVILSVGWLIIGCVQVLFVRSLFQTISFRLLGLWFLGVLVTGGSYALNEYIPILSIFNVYLSGLLYGCITGYVLERQYSISRSNAS